MTVTSFAINRLKGRVFLRQVAPSAGSFLRKQFKRMNQENRRKIVHSSSLLPSLFLYIILSVVCVPPCVHWTQTVVDLLPKKGCLLSGGKPCKTLPSFPIDFFSRILFLVSLFESINNLSLCKCHLPVDPLLLSTCFFQESFTLIWMCKRKDREVS